MQLHMKKNTNANSGQTAMSSLPSRSVLLLIPLRLGQDSFNMQYAEGLKVQRTSVWLKNLAKINKFGVISLLKALATPCCKIYCFQQVTMK